MKMDDIIAKSFDESIGVIRESRILTNEISKVVKVLRDCYEEKNKLLIIGNGGSAADSQHFAAELVGRYKLERKSLPAIALTTDTSIITAIGNDYGFDYVFSRQCESIVNDGDVVIAISTSGNSKNVINAITTSKKNGATTIAITGGDGGELSRISDISLKVPSNSTPRIQEAHRIIIHIICELVESYFKKD